MLVSSTSLCLLAKSRASRASRASAKGRRTEQREEKEQNMTWLSFELIGQITVLIIACKLLSSIYYRLILKPKHPLSYGKWVIVTGSTAGIGREYADYCAKMGMSIFLISRSESKLKEQQKELLDNYKGSNVEVRYLAYDFTDMGPAREKFYADLDKECVKMDQEGS